MLGVIEDKVTLESYEEDLYDNISETHKELLAQKMQILEQEKASLEAAGATVENSDDYRTCLEEILKTKKDIIDADVQQYDKEKALIENQVSLLGTRGNIAGRRNMAGIGSIGATMTAEEYANTLIELLKKEQDIFHQQAEVYRKNMYAEESEEIQALKSSWWQTQDKIVDIIKDLANDVADQFASINSTSQNVDDYITWYYGRMYDQLSIQEAYIQQQYDDETERLNKQDKLIDRQKQIQDAEAALVDAQKKRTMVMGENGRWTWRSDTKAVQDANKSLNDTLDNINKEIHDEQREEDLKNALENLWATYYGKNPETGNIVRSQAEADYLRTTNQSTESIYAYLKALEENKDFNGQLESRAAYLEKYGTDEKILEALREQSSNPELNNQTKMTIDELAANILAELGVVADRDAQGNVNIQQGINDVIAAVGGIDNLNWEQIQAISTLNGLRNEKIEATNGAINGLNGSIGTGVATLTNGITTQSGELGREIGGVIQTSNGYIKLAVDGTTEEFKNYTGQFNNAVNEYNEHITSVKTSVDSVNDTLKSHNKYLDNAINALEASIDNSPVVESE